LVECCNGMDRIEAGRCSTCLDCERREVCDASSLIVVHTRALFFPKKKRGMVHGMATEEWNPPPRRARGSTSTGVAWPHGWGEAGVMAGWEREGRNSLAVGDAASMPPRYAALLELILISVALCWWCSGRRREVGVYTYYHAWIASLPRVRQPPHIGIGGSASGARAARRGAARQVASGQPAISVSRRRCCLPPCTTHPSVLPSAALTRIKFQVKISLRITTPDRQATGHLTGDLRSNA
jgi:hypothetical protein